MLSQINKENQYVNITSPTYQKYVGNCALSLSVYDLLHPNNLVIYSGAPGIENIIMFHFLKSKIIFDSYGIESTLNTFAYGCYFSYPVTWYLEGSKDNNNWNVIDFKEDHMLNKRGVLHQISLRENFSFPYLRVRFLKYDASSDFAFSISRIEFFWKTNKKKMFDRIKI